MRRRGLLVAAALFAQPSARAARPPERLGFALGSGALHGWAHIGIVRACERLGIRPYAIAGCSAGAAVGALWAAGLSAEQIVRVASRMGWQSAGSFAWSVRGLRRNDALRDEIDRAVSGRSIGELPVRFAAVASDARSGEAVTLTRGPVGTAVAASSAVPVWFEPVKVDGRDLMDGSLTAPVPVAAARKLGAQRVVAVDVAYRPYEETPTGMADLAFQALHILGNTLAREQAKQADHVIKLDLHHLMHGRFDPNLLIEAGEAALLRLAPVLVQK